MKRSLIFAFAILLSAGALAQTQSPKDILKQVNDFRTKAMSSVHDMDSYQKVQSQLKDMVRDALKNVDPTKVDAKDAYDWAKLYSMIDEHKTVCDLTHEFLSTNPDPEQRYQDQALMMTSCNALGEAGMLQQTMNDVKPPTTDDSMEFAYQAPDYVDTIANKDGNAAGLKELNRLQSHLHLPDPKLEAQKMLDNEKKAGTPSQTGTPALTIKGANTSSPAMSDDQKLKRYETQVRGGEQEAMFGFAQERAKLLQGEGKKQDALKAMDDFSKTADLSPGLKNMADMTSKQIGLTGTSEVAISADKTIGSFSGLDSLKGKVVVLDFFAHWCGPCMASVPGMVKMYGDLHPQGLEIVGVTQYYGFFGAQRGLAQDAEFAKLQGLISDKNMTWPIVVGPKANSEAYGVWGIPETVLIDKKGTIRDIKVGYDEGQEAQIRTEIEGLLKE